MILNGVPVVLLFVSLLFGQEPEFRRLTVNDGLPSNTWTSMVQDPIGFLWIGGPAGLFRYDGYEFLPVLTVQGTPLPPVYALHPSPSRPGILYAGTENAGIYRVHGLTAHLFYYDSSFAEAFPRSIIEEHSGALWVSASGFLSRISQGRSTVFSDTSIASGISRIHRDSAGYVYILTLRDGLSIVRPDTLRGTLERISHWPLIEALSSSHNGIAAWEPHGTVRWFAAGSLVHSWIVPRGSTSAQEMVVENDSTLWLGNVDGLYRITKGFAGFERKEFTREHGLPERFVVPAMTDREGTVWFRSFSKGLLRTGRRSATVIDCTPPPIVANNASMIMLGDRLLAATTDGILTAEQTNGIWGHQVLRPSLPASEGFPNAVVAGPDGRIAVKHWYGTVTVHNSTKGLPLLSVIRPDGFFPEAYRSIVLYDRRGRLWCAAENAGVAVYRVQSGTNTRPAWTLREMPFRSVAAMGEMRNGSVWVADKKGRISIVQFDSSGRISVQPTRFFDGRPSLQIRAVVQDVQGRVWVGTKNHGIFLLNELGTAVTDSLTGPLYTQLHALNPVGLGGMMAAAAQGIIHIPVDTRLAPRLYVRQTGMYACGMTEDSLVWGMGENGIVLHQLQSESSPLTLPVRFTRITVNGTSEDTATALDLPYDRNNVTVSFAGLRFVEAASVRYRYRLLPTDSNWQSLGSQRTISFAALTPGRYILEVNADDDVVSTHIPPALLPITVRPPFWRTWWFIAVAVLLMIGAGAAGVRYRIRRWQQMERLRRRIAADLHDEIGSTLSGISILSGIAERSVISDPVTAAERLRSIGSSARRMMDSMSDIVWSIDPSNDPLENLLLRFREYAAELLEAQQIRYTFSFSNGSIELPMDVRRQLYLIMKEATANIVRHAAASSVRFSVTVRGQTIVVTIADDGCGMADPDGGTGNGIPNMRRRAAHMGGKFSIETAPGRGTTITVETGIRSFGKQHTP